MSAKPDDAATKSEDAPDLLRHYRPVAIRSVLAAHAMIPKHTVPAEPEPVFSAGFSLPQGFHGVPED